MVEKRIQDIFKKHGENGADGDCFGFFTNPELPVCQGCSVLKKCGRIQAEIAELQQQIPLERRPR